MGRWIKLFAEFVDWEWFTRPEMVQLFVWLLLNANAHDKSWQGLTISRGQLVTSRSKIMSATGLTDQVVRTCIERLKTTGEITCKSTNRYTVITVCNYERYQDVFNEDNQQNNQQATSKQPASNQQITTTLERKNIYINSLYNARTCEEEDKVTSREEIALQLFLGAQSSLDPYCMHLRLTREKCEQVARDIINEWKLQGKEHESVKDAREHLVNAIRARVNAERSNNTKQQDDTLQRQGQNLRRAAEVTANGAEDYKGDF